MAAEEQKLKNSFIKHP